MPSPKLKRILKRFSRGELNSSKTAAVEGLIAQGLVQDPRPAGPPLPPGGVPEAPVTAGGVARVAAGRAGKGLAGAVGMIAGAPVEAANVAAGTLASGLTGPFQIQRLSERPIGGVEDLSTRLGAQATGFEGSNPTERIVGRAAEAGGATLPFAIAGAAGGAQTAISATQGLVTRLANHLTRNPARIVAAEILIGTGGGAVGGAVSEATDNETLAIVSELVSSVGLLAASSILARVKSLATGSPRNFENARAEINAVIQAMAESDPDFAINLERNLANSAEFGLKPNLGQAVGTPAARGLHAVAIEGSPTTASLSEAASGANAQRLEQALRSGASDLTSGSQAGALSELQSAARTAQTGRAATIAERAAEIDARINTTVRDASTRADAIAARAKARADELTASFDDARLSIEAREASGTRLREAIRTERAAAESVADEVYNLVDPEKIFRQDASTLRAAVDDAARVEAGDNPRNVPELVQNMRATGHAQELGTVVTLDYLRNIRKNALSDLATLQGKDGQAAARLNKIVNGVEATLKQAEQNPQFPTIARRLDTANTFYRTKVADRFLRGDAASAQARGARREAQRIPLENLAETFIRADSRKGSLQALRQLNEIGSGFDPLTLPEIPPAAGAGTTRPKAQLNPTTGKLEIIQTPAGADPNLPQGSPAQTILGRRSSDEIQNAIQDSLIADFRSRITPESTPAAITRWLRQREHVFEQFPDLRTRFASVGRARQFAKDIERRTSKLPGELEARLRTEGTQELAGFTAATPESRLALFLGDDVTIDTAAQRLFTSGPARTKAIASEIRREAPELLPALRRMWWDGMTDSLTVGAARTNRLDAAILDPRSLDRIITQNRDMLTSVYSPQHVRFLEKVRDSARMLARTSDDPGAAKAFIREQTTKRKGLIPTTVLISRLYRFNIGVLAPEFIGLEFAARILKKASDKVNEGQLRVIMEDALFNPESARLISQLGKRADRSYITALRNQAERLADPRRITRREAVVQSAQVGARQSLLPQPGEEAE